MTKVTKVQTVITTDEKARLIKEASLQQRPLSNLTRKYINEGVKRDEDIRNCKL